MRAIRLALLNLILASGTLFLFQAYWQERRPEGTEAVVPPAPSAAQEEALPVHQPPQFPPREETKVVEDKNLFTQARSPAPPPSREVVDAKPTPPPENLQERYLLYGTIRIEGKTSQAILKDKKTPNSKPQVLAQGDSLPGNHQLIKVQDDLVVVKAAHGAEVELRLRGPKGSEDTSFTPKPVSPQVAAPAIPSPLRQPEILRPLGMEGKFQPPQMQSGRPAPPHPAPAVVRPQRRPPVVQEAEEEEMLDEEDLSDEELGDDEEYLDLEEEDEE
jgi:hypothetical protein